MPGTLTQSGSHGLWQVAEFTGRSDGGAGRKVAERDDSREGCGADGPEPAASTAPVRRLHPNAASCEQTRLRVVWVWCPGRPLQAAPRRVENGESEEALPVPRKRGGRPVCAARRGPMGRAVLIRRGGVPVRGARL